LFIFIGPGFKNWRLESGFCSDIWFLEFVIWVEINTISV